MVVGVKVELQRRLGRHVTCTHGEADGTRDEGSGRKRGGRARRRNVVVIDAAEHTTSRMRRARAARRPMSRPDFDPGAWATCEGWS
jgi:hypothetical protein